MLAGFYRNQGGQAASTDAASTQSLRASVYRNGLGAERSSLHHSILLRTFQNVTSCQKRKHIWNVMARRPSLCDKTCASLVLYGVAIKLSESETHFPNKNRLCLFSTDFALAPVTPVPPAIRCFHRGRRRCSLFPCLRSHTVYILIILYTIRKYSCKHFRMTHRPYG